MQRRIDVAWFECLECGHRCTAPEAINSIPHQMETFAVLPAKDLPKEAEQGRIAQLQARHRGNTFTIQTRSKIDPKDNTKTIPDTKVIRVARSYAKTMHLPGAAVLEESHWIMLKCPQCDAVLYEVSWEKPRRQRFK